jgi:hypothetical protein
MSNVRRFEKRGLVYVRGYKLDDRQTPFKEGFLITWIVSQKPREQALEEVRKDEEAFNSFSIDEKVWYVTLMLSLQEVTRLKFEIHGFLEPKRRFEANITFLFAQSTFEPFRTWLLQTCLRSKENAQKALATVEEFEKRLQNELFHKKNRITVIVKIHQKSAYSFVTSYSNVNFDQGPSKSFLM